MKISMPALEAKVDTQNEWLKNHPDTHDEYWKERQKRDYYRFQLCEMDRLGLTTIKIQIKYK